MHPNAHPDLLAAGLVSTALLLSGCGLDSWSAQTDNGELEFGAEFATLGSGGLAPGRATVSPRAPTGSAPRETQPLDPGAAATGSPLAAGGGADFDWCVPVGQTVILDTSFTTIVGGPHCIPTVAKNVVNGVLEVHDLRIGQGGLLKVLGPNPLVVLATGQVIIDGTIDVSGIDSPGVMTLNTTSIPETGAAGQAGGGRGGTGSPQTTASSVRGGNGFGAFDAPDQGGKGGETGWSNISAAQTNTRRGAGGGGGGFGRNQAQTLGSVATFGQWDQGFIGLDVEPGFGNLEPNSNGADSGAVGPLGGRAGSGPFVDGDPSNDFYGVAVDLDTGAEIVGELRAPWAGAGGGAGGDASFVGIGGTFPKLPFNPAGDEKGAGGAGGGGTLHVIAVGDISFGPGGLIKARGGSGGGGENTLFLNRVGGGSGGGSGGHVILETAGVIDFSAVSGPGSTAGQLAAGILATGGQGGAGKSDAGGATFGPNGKVETPPSNDACPAADSNSDGYPMTGPNACMGHVDGAGGDGGPGLIQLHTLGGFDPADPGIVLPAGLTIGDLCVPAPVGLRQNLRLKPRFELGATPSLREPR